MPLLPWRCSGLISSTITRVPCAKKAAPNSEKKKTTLVLAHVCFLTSHSRACSRAGGPCSNRCRWARLNTRRTWRRSRARSARSRAAGSGRRWETRSPHTALPLPWTPDLEGPHHRSGWTDRCNYGPQILTPSGQENVYGHELVYTIKSEHQKYGIFIDSGPERTMAWP